MLLFRRWRVGLRAAQIKLPFSIASVVPHSRAELLSHACILCLLQGAEPADHHAVRAAPAHLEDIHEWRWR